MIINKNAFSLQLNIIYFHLMAPSCFFFSENKYGAFKNILISVLSLENNFLEIILLIMYL